MKSKLLTRIFISFLLGMLGMMIGCEKEFNVDTSIAPSQTQNGVTLTVTRIAKSIDYSGVTSYALGGTIPQHPGSLLIVWATLMSENKELIDHKDVNDKVWLRDNLGNRMDKGMNTSTMKGTRPRKIIIGGRYFRKAKTFNLFYEVASARESDCDIIEFNDIKLNQENIPKWKTINLSKTANGTTITLERIWVSDPKSLGIFMLVPKGEAGMAKHVGVKKVIDNLGNEYQRNAGGNELNGSKVNFSFPDFDPAASSISFKYLISRNVLSFELKDLPLP